MWGWLRSLGLGRRSGGASAEPRPLRSLECLDGEASGALPAVGLNHLADVVVARILHATAGRGESIALPPGGGPGPSAGQAGAAPRAFELTAGRVGPLAADGRQALLALDARPNLLSELMPPESGVIRTGAPPDPAQVGLLLEQWLRDAEEVVAGLVAAGIERRLESLPRAGGLARGPGAAGEVAPAARGGRTPPPVPDGSQRATSVVVKPDSPQPAEHWPEFIAWAGGTAVWGVPLSALAAVPVADGVGVAAAAATGLGPQPSPGGAAGSEDGAQPGPEPAGFLCPIFPFDAAGIRVQMAHLRDLLNPVVPLVEEWIGPSYWWVGAAAVGAGVVAYSHHASTRRRKPDPSAAAVRHGRSDRPRPASRPTVPDNAGGRSLAVVEVGVEG